MSNDSTEPRPGDVVTYLKEPEWGPLRVRFLERDAFRLEELDGTERRLAKSAVQDLCRSEPKGLQSLAWKHRGEPLLEIARPDEIVIAALQDEARPLGPQDIERVLTVVGVSREQFQPWWQAEATKHALKESPWLDLDPAFNYHLRRRSRKKQEDSLARFLRLPDRISKKPLPRSGRAAPRRPEPQSVWNPAKLDLGAALVREPEWATRTAPQVDRVRQYLSGIVADLDASFGARLRAASSICIITGNTEDLQTLLQAPDWDAFDPRDLGTAEEVLDLMERQRNLGGDQDPWPLLQRLVGAPQTRSKGQPPADAAWDLVKGAGREGEALLFALPWRFEWALARLLESREPSRQFSDTALGLALGEAVSREGKDRARRQEALREGLRPLAERYPESVPALARELLRSSEISPERLAELFEPLRNVEKVAIGLRAVFEGFGVDQRVLRAWDAREKAPTPAELLATILEGPWNKGIDAEGRLLDRLEKGLAGTPEEFAQWWPVLGLAYRTVVREKARVNSLLSAAARRWLNAPSSLEVPSDGLLQAISEWRAQTEEATTIALAERQAALDGAQKRENLAETRIRTLDQQVRGLEHSAEQLASARARAATNSLLEGIVETLDELERLREAGEGERVRSIEARLLTLLARGGVRRYAALGETISAPLSQGRFMRVDDQPSSPESFHVTRSGYEREDGVVRIAWVSGSS